MERIDWILGATGAVILALLLWSTVAFAVEAQNPGDQQPASPAGQSEQLTPAPEASAQPPMGRGMGPMGGGIGMGRGMMMAHPCPCAGGMPGMRGPMGMHGMGMGMLMAARRDPKGVALMMRMRADMLKLRAQMLEGKARVLEKYANEIEAGVR